MDDVFNSGREQEDDMYEIIREEDDGSQYLNDSGEGMFQEEPRDEGHNQNNDDEENALQLTKSGEVYIYKASDDLITCSN